MRRLLKRTDTGIIIGCIFVFVLFSLWNPQQWFDWGNLSNIGQYTAILGFLAIGQTFVILIREIDLSVGSVYGIVGITFVSLENSNVSVPVSFILAMLLALADRPGKCRLGGPGEALLDDRDPWRSFFLSWAGLRDDPWRRHRGAAGCQGKLAGSTPGRALASDRE